MKSEKLESKRKHLLFVRAYVGTPDALVVTSRLGVWSRVVVTVARRSGPEPYCLAQRCSRALSPLPHVNVPEDFASRPAIYCPQVVRGRAASRSHRRAKRSSPPWHCRMSQWCYDGLDHVLCAGEGAEHQLMCGRRPPYLDAALYRADQTVRIHTREFGLCSIEEFSR
jgi:hypothetical protein